ncbi:MAG: hypothetical protein WKF84_23720 [Pyrinomonadaceae bacterium]
MLSRPWQLITHNTKERHNMAPPWDGDDLAGRAEEAAERGQAAVDERERRRVIRFDHPGKRERELEERIAAHVSRTNSGSTEPGH